MKKLPVILAVTVAILSGWAAFTTGAQTETPSQPATEYVTLHWDGRDNSHVIRPDGVVEFLGAKFKGIKKSDRADERAYFMNLAMNALSREGYELVSMTPDDYVFRRPTKR